MSLPTLFYFLIPSSLIVFTVGLSARLKSKKKEGLVFFILAAIQSILGFCVFLSSIGYGNFITSVYLDKIINCIIIISIPLFFHLSLELSGRARLKENRLLLPLSYVFAICLSWILVVEKFLLGFSWASVQLPNLVFAVYATVFSLLAVINIFIKWRAEKKDVDKKVSLFYSLSAFLLVLMMSFGSIDVNMNIYPFYCLSFALFSLIIFYVITEKELFIETVGMDILASVAFTVIPIFLLFPEIELGIWSRASIVVLILAIIVMMVRYNHLDLERDVEAKRAEKLKEDFISIVSHQLRTPLSAIRGYADMLKEGDFEKLPEVAMTPVNYIHDSSVGMIRLVNGLLSVSRLDNGKINLEIGDIDIPELVTECVNEIKPLTEQKRLFLRYKKPSSALIIKGDRNKMKQAILNILGNAVWYTLKGGVTVKVVKLEDTISIEVSDTGVGIDKEDIKRIFTSFSRGKRAPELYVNGTGLGLYVAKSLIEMHNGWIAVESEKDHGSTFYINIPLESSIMLKQEIKLSPDSVEK